MNAKKAITILCSFFLAVTLLISNLPAVLASERDLTYEFHSNTESYTVSKCSKSAVGEIIIPSTYLGKPVTGIETFAVYECSQVTKVVIEQGITYISSYAFSECGGLTEIVIPESVKAISEEAFAGCTQLSKVHISSIKGWMAIQFSGVNANPLCYANQLYLNGALVTRLEIPEDATAIGENAFCSYKNLREISFPNHEITIGMGAFDGCENIMKLTLNGNVTVGNYAFRNCKALTTVSFGGEEVLLNGYAFDGCTALKTISIAQGSVKIGEYAFSDCQALEEIILPQTLDFLGEYAFKNCTALKEITLPKGITAIENSTFSNCDALTKVELPPSVTTVKSSAFQSCSALTQVILPNSVAEIGGCAFYGCGSIKTIVLPESLEHIGFSAFSECVGLQSVIIKNKEVCLEKGVFENCTNLTDVWYSGSAEEKNNLTVVAEGNQWFTQAKWHYNTCTQEHQFAGECDTTCERCEWVRMAPANHTYREPCDARCAVCKTVRTQIPHTWGSKLQADASGHWYQCVSCEEQKDFGEHEFQKGKCVHCEFAVPVPTPLLGDVNNDTKIDAKDALLVLRIAVGKHTPTQGEKAAADPNADGKTDAKDALEILKYAVGKPSVLAKAR